MSYEKYFNNSRYTPEEFQSIIKERPLNIGEIERILDGVVEVIEFVPLTGAKARIIPYMLRHKCKIWLGSNESRETQKVGLIHEIAHAFYSFWGPQSRYDRELEKLMQKEIKRFYEENPGFVEEVFSRIPT